MVAVNELPVLSIITWAPFLAALAIMAGGRHRPLFVRWTALAGTGLSLGLSLWMYATYDVSQAGFQFAEQFPLVPSLGITYEVAIDGMSGLMVLLTALHIATAMRYGSLGR